MRSFRFYPAQKLRFSRIRLPETLHGVTSGATSYLRRGYDSVDESEQCVGSLLVRPSSAISEGLPGMRTHAHSRTLTLPCRRDIIFAIRSSLQCAQKNTPKFFRPERQG